MTAPRLHRCFLKIGAAMVMGTVLCALPANAEKFALVIGINAYTAPVPRLKGAVSDAQDIAGALKVSGASQIIMLVDEQATRKAIFEAWDGLLAKAKSGDTIVVSFAGHGSQEPAAANDTSEADGLDDNFLLVNYAPKGTALAERIVDNEIAKWLDDAKAKGVRVIFVADSCHSGTMFRSISLGVTYRSAPRFNISKSDLLKFAPPKPDATLAIEKDDPITFLAAVPEDRLAPELEIGGKPRGGLSWAFSRALEGAADADKNGIVTERELTTFVRAAVQQQSDSQQITQSFPAVSRSIEVLGAEETAVVPATTPTAEPDASLAEIKKQVEEKIAIEEKSARSDALKLAYRGGQGAPVEGATVVPEDDAELVYDVATRTVEKRVAGIVAEDVDPEGLPGIVAKWRAIDYLKAGSARGAVDFGTVEEPRTFARGDKFTVKLTGSPLPYMTIFNLPPNGRVEFFYPANEQEAGESYVDRDFVLPLKVQDPPFGAEHLVAIMSKEPLTALHTDLGSMSDPNAAVALPDVLARGLEGQDYAIGVANIFTSGGS